MFLNFKNICCCVFKTQSEQKNYNNKTVIKVFFQLLFFCLNQILEATTATVCTYFYYTLLLNKDITFKFT